MLSESFILEQVENLNFKDKQKYDKFVSQGYEIINYKLFQKKESGYDYQSVGPEDNRFYFRKEIKKKTSVQPQPTKPPQPTNQPQPTKPPTNTPSTTFDPPKYNLYALNNVQRLERDGLVVDCDDTFPFPIKKDGKFCRSKKIGEFNKCFFNHDLKNIAGEDLIIYLKDLGFTIEDGVREFSYNEILKTCSLSENKEILRKIIKENTIKILSEYLNK